MKSYTDLEQSKKLAEFLPTESADMEYILEQWIDEKTYRHKEAFCEIPVVKVEDDCPLQPITLDCWSLAALLSLLPNNEHIETTISRGSWKIDTIEYLPNTWWCEYEDNESLTEFNTSADNPIDACVEMIVKLHELNLL